jgi:uncharacterized membrane protein YfcA
LELTQLLFILLGFFASLISAVFGFGTALLVLAIGSHILPVKETIALATVLFAASTITKTIVFGKHIDWRVAGYMALVSLPFAFAGASLMVHMPTDVLKRSLGAMIMLYIIFTRCKYIPAVKIGTIGLIVGSASYGFVSGLLGSGSIIKAVIFREMSISKEAFVGVMAATSVLSNLAKLTAYTKSDLLGRELAVEIVGLVTAAMLAVFIGRRILRGMNAFQFEAGLQVILFISAVGLLM